MMPLADRIRRRDRHRGLTLLEVLVSLMLICTTMVAFASVYPAAFKLNRKTHKAVQAAEYASAVIEELRSLNVHKPNATETSGGNFLEDFEGDSWLPAEGINTLNVQIPEPFSLLSPEKKSGIMVQRGIGGSFFVITVTIYWKETVMDHLVNKQVSIISARSSNR